MHDGFFRADGIRPYIHKRSALEFVGAIINHPAEHIITDENLMHKGLPFTGGWYPPPQPRETALWSFGYFHKISLLILVL